MRKILIFLLIIFINENFGQTACFMLPVKYNIGPNLNPQAVISTDIDNDGYADLIVSNTIGYKISLYRGSSTGSLTSPVYFNTGVWPITMSVSDFNLDGKKDIVTGNLIGGISVLFGTGTASFTAPANYTTLAGYNLGGVTSGDFDNDGKTDIAVVNSNTPNITVFKNNGTGSFTVTNNYSITANGLYVKACDLNNDGKSDLLCLTPPSSLNILLANNTGSFNSPLIVNLFSNANYFITDDFNKDGKKDLAVSHTSNAAISVLLGTGTGTFLPATTITIPNGADKLIAGDFNSDTNPDIIASNSSSVGILTYLPGSGNGAFVTSNTFTNNNSVLWMTAADINGDGRDDYASVDVNDNSLITRINCLGMEVNEFKNENFLSIFPNPFINKLNVIVNEISEISLMDISGKEIMNIENPDGKLELDGSELNPGVYILKVIHSTGNQNYYKVIKQ